ncbi:glutathione S-transferase isoform X1 [Halyomorpha halys]|uniref:glutathione S-transferase isoform X1 n=1 Tax=Halyomorpha halys TaxID=286706 RepID=UPI0006D50A6A|nr:glutathione S-transferase [Halyomorpha halys]
MTTYKLTYFNIMGLGETIRYMLSYLGKDFEDFRITDYPSWINEHKPKMPFEKIPLLEFDGHRLHQSMAICRYFAKEAKLNGDNAWEELQIDMIMDSFVDFRHSVWSYFYNRDENNKEHLKATLFNKTVPLYLGKFDKLLEEQGYLANGKLSWADLYFAAVIGYFSFMLKLDIVKEYPNIGAFREKIHAIPNIKAWLDKRPTTEW